MNRHIAIAASGAALAFLSCLQTGCANWPGRNLFSNVSLPSPAATLAATKTEPEQGNKEQPSLDAAAPTIAQELARGRTYERSGQNDKARKVYEDLRRRNPDNADIAHRLGVVADSQKRHGEAEQLFLIALEKDPNNSEVLCDLGYCYYLQGRLDKAETYLSQAVDRQPANSRYRNNLGLVLGHMGRYDDALAQFRAAGSQADAYYNLAFVCASQNRVDEAKKCFQKALMIDPSYQPARDALASFNDYERLSPELRELDTDTEYVDNGVRYVPHQALLNREAEQTVQQASANMAVSDSMSASRTSRNLQMQSRGLLNRNMQSQRQDNLASQPQP